VFLSNNHDWDQHFTMAEVDRRAWLLNHELPKWSYQLCGGATRIGDPISLGVSPLFTWVLAFGSVLGLKLLVLFSAAMGVLYTHKLLTNIRAFLKTPGTPPTGEEQTLWILAFLFVMGNSFLWRFQQGHVTFVAHCFSIGILAYFAQACLGTFRKRDFIAASLTTWCVLENSSYHAGFFVLFPFGLAMIFVCAGLAAASRDSRKLLVDNVFRLWKPAAFLGAGLLLSSYKLYHVIHFQLSHPRAVSESDLNEVGSLWKTLVYQFSPTYKSTYVALGGGANPLQDTFGIWEFSSFSVVNWIFFAGLLFVLSGRQPRRSDVLSRQALHISLLCGAYALILFLLSLGNGAPWYPHALLNHYVFGDSVRAIGRYQFGLTLSILVMVVVLMRRAPRLSVALNSWMGSTALFLALVNVLTFYPGISRDLFDQFWNAPVSSDGRIRTMAVTRVAQQDDLRTYMYEHAAAGEGILNCYVAFAHEQRLDQKYLFFQDPKMFGESATVESDVSLPLFSQPQALPASCVAGSFLTQNEVHLDSSCPIGACLNINSANIYADTGLELDRTKNRYCLSHRN
jgi:hypothetical protein